MRKCNKMKCCLFLLLGFLLMNVLSMSVSAADSPSISKKSATLAVGKTLTLKMKNTKKKVTWSSSKNSVATVSNKGKVKAIKAGKAKITAKVSGKKYTCKVTVKNANSKASSVKFGVSDGGDFVKGTSKANISFKLKYTSTAVKVRVQTVSGTTVYTKTFAKCKENKAYSFQWDGKNNKGKYVNEATYRLCIVAGSTKTYSSQMKFYNNTDFAGGNGSKSKPYQIKTLAQLKKVTKYNGRYFVQTANIDGDDANFQPLFTSDNPFTGNYNGKGYTISNLYFRTTGDVGLFAVIGEKGIVTNVKIYDFTFVSFAENAGAIAGKNLGTIMNCKVENSTMGNGAYPAQGGICGYSIGVIESCTAKGISINNSGGKEGGIVGHADGGKVIDCTAEDVAITGGYVGGIVGYASGSAISGCNTIGKCSFACDNLGHIGAIVGSNWYSTITDCYTDTEYNLAG